MARKRTIETQEETHVPREFDTAYDRTLVGLLLGAITFPWVLVANDHFNGTAPPDVWWIVSGATLFTVGIIRAMAWPVRYVIDGEVLRVHSGFIKYRVMIGSITRIEPTRSAISSPAWSFHKLRIHFRVKGGLESSIMISPADRDGFFAALEHAAGRSLRE